MLRCDTRNLGLYRRDYVIDDDHSVVMALDNFLAFCAGKFGQWKDIPDYGTRPLTFSSGGVFTGKLSGNAFDGGMPIWPRSGMRLSLGALPVYSHHTRAVSLVDAPSARDDYGFLNLVTDMAVGLVPWALRGVRVSSVAKLCLKYAADAGWKTTETFCRMRSPLDLVEPGNEIRGVIYGRCENWLDALVITTLTSAGYFVVVDVNGICVPGVSIAAAHGFHAIGKNPVSYVPLVLSCVIDGEMFNAPWLPTERYDYFLGCRRPEGHGNNPYVGFDGGDFFNGKRNTVRSYDGAMVQRLVHYVVCDDTAHAVRYREKPIDADVLKRAASELFNSDFGSIFGLGKNCVYSVDMATFKYIVVNDDTRDGIPLDEVAKGDSCWMEVRNG